MGRAVCLALRKYTGYCGIPRELGAPIQCGSFVKYPVMRACAAAMQPQYNSGFAFTTSLNKKWRENSDMGREKMAQLHPWRHGNLHSKFYHWVQNVGLENHCKGLEIRESPSPKGHENINPNANPEYNHSFLLDRNEFTVFDNRLKKICSTPENAR